MSHRSTMLSSMVAILAGALVPQAPAADVSFDTEVMPIFRMHCQGCHQPARAGGEFVMTDFAHLMSQGESGELAISAGKPDASLLMELITPAEDGTAAMPQDAAALSNEEIEIIRNWIAQGAKDDSPAATYRYTQDNPPAYHRPPLTTSLGYSPDGKWIAVSGFHEVALVDAKTLKVERRLVGMSQRIESVNFSPNSSRLAVTGGSPGRVGEVQVWQVDSGELLLSRQFGFDTIAAGRFSPNGKLIAFGCSDNTLRAIDAETGEQVLHQGAHADWIRACVFTPDSKHIVSASRDMSVKLTEVETERFVDNVTSITPGALRGGANSLAMHPERNEFLLGGADGALKVYRVFRETERKIGDDANLVRKFPAMPGRIFSVAISPDAKWLAAASTLDGVSQIDVYPYSFEGKLPAQVKAAMAKQLSGRNAEEKQRIEDYTTDIPKRQFSIQLSDSRIYTIAFSGDSSQLAAGGSDGIFRLYDTVSGELASETSLFPISSTPDDKTTETGQLALADGLKPKIPGLNEERATPADAVNRLSVEPQELKFSKAKQYAQLVVTAHGKDGASWDVSRQVDYSQGASASVSSAGLVRPIASGNSSIEIRLGDTTADVTVATQLLADIPSPDFVRDVNPLLSKLGCNAGTCHGAQKGKNGFKLSLRGYDPLEDLRALSDDLVSRRLNTAAPDASLMLRKLLGDVPHEGGVLASRDSAYYAVLRRWIGDGAQLKQDSSKVERIELFPKKPVIQREGSWQQFRVMAYFPDGTSRDVTREAFVDSGNSEVCVTHATGLVQAIRRGEAPILTRYEGAYAATTVTVMGNREGFAWQPPPAETQIDKLVADKWQRMKILPTGLCTDAEFLRRVHLDLTGLPPTTETLQAFLVDPTPSADKRAAQIELLIGNADYVDHWTNKWADLLQVNSKFLGSDGAKAYRDWIHEAVGENRPYDKFARQVLTASGSNKDNPAASYYKILRDPDLIMENTTHLFLAVRFNCNKCHDHPFERWTQDQYYELAAFFAQTKLTEDPQSKGKKLGGTAVEGAKPLYELISDSTDGEMTHIRTGNEVAPSFPYDSEHDVPDDATRRQRLAAWMTSPDNPYFATSYVNRIWGYLTGTGIIMPLDDIRAGNPPSNPELLRHLTEEFIATGFDTQKLVRSICNSRTYQLSIGTNKWNADDTLNYSHAKARRLPAEVLYDAVYQVTGAISQIPGVAPGTRAAQLPDVAIQLSDGFLNNLGRPVRESSCECERSDGLQLGPIMALVSGPTIGKAISDPKCVLPAMAGADTSLDHVVRQIYLRVLSRPATDTEVDAVVASVGEIGTDHTRLKKQLAQRETWWETQHDELEAKRHIRQEETRAKISARTAAIREDRTRAEQDRLAAIKAAEEAVAAYAKSSTDLAKKYLDTQQTNANWFPLVPVAMSASNKAILAVGEDRSIRASGNADKGSYTLTFETPLPNISGFRIEALPVEGIAGGGPGLPSNGNFVLTEVHVDASPLGAADKQQRVKLKSAKADFTQGGFMPDRIFDGKEKDQGGWAVHPRGGTLHWLTFELNSPIDFEGGSRITLTLHQNHDAVDHRLARFRISATTDSGAIPLGLPEQFAALKLLPAEARTEQSLAGLVSYLVKNDTQWTELAAAVTAAKMPLPEDDQIVALKKTQALLEKETPVDAQLLRLRSDVEISQQQLGNLRLTLAQDLTWALINSPSFLFNR